MSGIRIPVITPGVSRDPASIDPQKIKAAFDDTGVALLRGFDFDLKSLEDFTHILCTKFHLPPTRHNRRKTEGDHYSSEVIQSNYVLLGHTEASYHPGRIPDVCFFMCTIPPVFPGGETTVTDGITFLERLPKELRQRFEQSGITYEMLWEQDRWQPEFDVEDVAALETLLSPLPGVKYSINGTTLHLFYSCDAITAARQGSKVFAPGLLAHLPRVTHPNYTGMRVHAKPTNRVYFGDGEEIPDAVINTLIDIHDNISYLHIWDKNDVLVIDNSRYMHGRTLTQGDCERVLIGRFGWFN